MSRWPGHDERFLVREQQALAGAGGRERRVQSGGAHDRRHDAIGFRQCRDLRERLDACENTCRARIGAQRGDKLARGPLIRHGRIRRPEATDLLRELSDAAVGAERHQPKAIRVARQHIERAIADGAGGTRRRPHRSW